MLPTRLQDDESLRERNRDTGWAEGELEKSKVSEFHQESHREEI